MTVSNVRVSIVTPSFNQARFVDETIRSVLDQGFPNLEYIVVDGGSTDGAIELVEQYRSQLAALIVEKDHGQADAIAKGFRLASGDVLAWLNSDDLLAPGALDAVAAYFAGHPEVDLLYGDVELIDADGRRLRTVKSIDFHWRTLLLDHHIIPQQTAFWRREAYERAGGLDPALRFCMDLDLWMRMYQTGARFERVDRVLGRFRLHASAKTALLTNVHDAERAQLVARALNRQPTWTERHVIRLWCRIRRLTLQCASDPVGTVRSWAGRLRLGR